MLQPIYEPMNKLAQILIKEIDWKLDPQDIAILKNDGPNYLRRLQTNIKLKKDPLDDLSDTEKKVLLAYVIFLRQNITMEKGDKTNQEDAAKILHGEVLSSKKKNNKELEEQLLKQLEKIGIDVKNKDKE